MLLTAITYDTHACRERRTARMTQAGTPGYSPTALRTWLRERVNALEPGTLFESDSAVAAKWGISTRTVQRAMNVLAGEGLVVRIQGKGTLKAGAPSPAQQRAAPHRHSSVDSLAQSLHAAIRDGSLRRGDALPKLTYVSLRYQVSEHTVVGAYRQLQRLGLVSKIGNRYRVGGVDIWDVARTRRVAWLIVPSAQRLEATFTDHMFARAYRRFEEELTGCGIALRCFEVSKLRTQLRRHAEKTLVPVGIAVVSPSSAYLEDTLRVVARELGDVYRRGIRVLAEVTSIAAFTRKPPGVSAFGIGHLRTAQARALAEHVCTHVRRDVVIVRNWPGGGDLARSYIRTNKIVYAIAGHPQAPRRVIHAFMAGEDTPEDAAMVMTNVRKNAAYHAYLSAEFGTDAADVDEPADTCIYRDMRQLCATIDGKVVWLCESAALALEARRALHESGRAVPGDVALISLESSPQVVANGISSCTPDFATLGYLMAHVLVGDFEPKRTSHGFIRVPGRVVERFTTPWGEN
ncbi:MAG: GntR family transcriptional regulator [Chitinivibrionales bacterium]|nr:GntR family transcriptional regulator [Chitinivibrionales bacterium]